MVPTDTSSVSEEHSMKNQQKIPTKISPVIALAITIQIIFMIVVISVIVHANSQNHEITTRNDRPRVTLNDLSSGDTNLPQNYIEDISLSLTSAMELNTTKLNVPASSAIVRDGSLILTQFEKQQFNALSFIVDIPDLEQSYQIYYKYPVNTDTTTTPYFNNPRAVLCLDENSQIIYPDFNCQSLYPADTRQRIATDYLPFFEFNTSSAAIDSKDPTIINITPVTTDTNLTDETYITEIKSAISSLGVSPTLFQYHVIHY